MDNTRNEKCAAELAELIRAETVSEAGKKNTEKYEAFHEKLFDMFPRLFAGAETEDFDGSLLIRWKGKSSKEPILLMSHHDVVEAPGEWTHPPFSGEIADGRLWGRGTLDTKGSLWAMLRAADELISEGFTPNRDVYFESSCNEETDGSGSDRISAVLRDRGIRFFMTLDEGGMMMYDPIGGADGTFAMVGVGEKGCADLKFIARSAGGHASTPGRNTPLVRLGKFMAAAERSGIFRVQLPGVVEEMLRRMAPYMHGPLKAVFKNAGRLKLLLCRAMPLVSPTAGAMLKTTLAFTMSRGSEGTNVLPQEAYVIGNMRFSHHQGGKDSIEKITALAKRYDIETQVLDAGFESPLSDCNSEAFKLVERAVSAVFPGTVPVPYIMTGASDSRFFSRVSDNCIRFAPFTINEQQLDSIHGLDENVDIDTLAPAVDFYKYIIKEV